MEKSIINDITEALMGPARYRDGVISYVRTHEIKEKYDHCCACGGYIDGADRKMSLCERCQKHAVRDNVDSMCAPGDVQHVQDAAIKAARDACMLFPPTRKASNMGECDICLQPRKCTSLSLYCRTGLFLTIDQCSSCARRM